MARYKFSLTLNSWYPPICVTATSSNKLFIVQIFGCDEPPFKAILPSLRSQRFFLEFVPPNLAINPTEWLEFLADSYGLVDRLIFWSSHRRARPTDGAL